MYDDFYITFFWLLFIIIIIIIVIIIIFSHIKQYALFQATRDQVWYPEDNHKSPPEDNLPKLNYTEGFTDCYLIIDDRKRRAFSKAEITKIENSKTFNIGDLHYINIWKFEQFPGNRVVLYYHGNNDNISYRKYVIDICNTLELNLILVDYRGYGDSASLPSNKFLLEDAKVAYEHVRTEYESNDIIIWGESLGGIAAIWTAHKYRCNALILLSTFADLRTLVEKMDINESFKNILKKLAKSKLMNNGKWIRDVRAPIVIIHSPDDDILPYVNAEMLYSSVKSTRKKLINIAGPHAHPYFKYENLVDLLNFIQIEDSIIQDNDKMNKILDIINNL